MRKLIYILLLSNYVTVYGQHKLIPLQSYYKNEFLRFSKNKSLETFFPANETQLNLTDSIRDSTIFYYQLPIWFFQKHWIEVKKNDGKLFISPFVNFSYGKNLNPLDRVTTFRNTRGVYMEGEILKRLSFNFILSENQALFMDYEAKYFETAGEFYVLPDSSYGQVNAVIPSGARTKPFKTGSLANAYDYAFSIGSVSWNMLPSLRLEIGNNQHFIGVGYRSILLSDNSTHAPYMKLNWKVTQKWSFQFLSRKQQNLFRKPKSNGIESGYEKKLFTAAYLSYRPIENLSLSLFSSGNQLRADSIRMNSLQFQMFLPISNSDLLYHSSKINGIAGFNLDFSIRSFRLYGQLAMDKVRKKYLAACQVGFYWFNLFNFKNLDLQLEYNYVPDLFYASEDLKLSYSHSNLPSAHPKGNNFSELLAVVKTEWKRIYLSMIQLTYFSEGNTELLQYASNSIFTYHKSSLAVQTGTTFVTQLELGYRFNRKYNPTIYISGKYRIAEYGNYLSKNLMLMGGLKVDLFNQYTDF